MRPLPNWDIWKHVPTLTATEAVALTLNIEPHSVYEWSAGKWVYSVNKKGRMCISIKSFAERLFLFKRCFGANGKISLIQLSDWSQSVGWNIPIMLAAFSPVEPTEILKTMPAEAILKALEDIVAEKSNIDKLQEELIRLDVKFIICNDLETVQIPDGTVNGERAPISNLYSVVCELCRDQGNSKLLSLIRGSGSSGGESIGSTYRGSNHNSYKNPLIKAENKLQVRDSKSVSVENHKCRRNILDPAIDTAIKAAGNDKCADVYLQLREMALNEVLPFSGVTNNGLLCYTNDNDAPAELSKNALRQRLKRRR